MDTTFSTARSLGATRADSRVSDAWTELVAAMPIVIFYRALRDVFRLRAHKRAVLEAFRR
jgi:hypothetical protein